MRLVSLPTVVRALAIFLASLQTARVGAAQAHTFGEGQLQTSSVAALPLHATPLGLGAADAAAFARVPGRLSAPAVPADSALMAGGLVAATAAARSPRSSGGDEPEALQADRVIDGQQSTAKPRWVAEGVHRTARIYGSAHRPRAPCISLV